MVKRERSVKGDSPTGTGGAGKAAASASQGRVREPPRYWVSHRTYLFHANGGPCQPVPLDNVGYISDVRAVIDQGFAPCPKCIVKEA